MSKCCVRKKKKKIEDCIVDNAATKRINWFPGHMHKAVKKIKERLKQVDVALEIRDARSPLVTGNKAMASIIGEKCHLIVINKANLADPENLKLWDTWFAKQQKPYIIINCFDKASMKKIVTLSKDILHKKRQQSNPDCKMKTKLKMMILGLPNTGKSTIINQLASRKATKVAAKPGQTQHQLWVNIDNDLQVLDTPGVMPPQIEKYEHGVWLSALHAIPEKIVEPEVTACYIVEHLLKIKSNVFKEHYKLKSFDLDLITALNQIATTRGCIRKKNEYDYQRVYKLILHDFRNGELGLISFGMPPQKNYQN